MTESMSYDEISALGEVLCTHCFCTEYGLSMGAQNMSGASPGCEGSYCRDAYEQYLRDCEEEE